MDTCSSEIVALIFDHAWHGDFGQTARNLGLVSKYFRAIAEPIELRAIAVSGIDQLHGAVARLERANEGIGETEFSIRHLFISELKMKHALAADMYFANIDVADYLPRDRFWKTRQGIKAESFLRQNSGEFWRTVAGLVRNSSPNLRTLYLLASENFFPPRGSFSKGDMSSKVLGVLSGLEFPQLMSLMVNHDAVSEISCSSQNGLSFRAPATPLLGKLHVRSPIFIGNTVYRHRPHRSHIHPLIELVHLGTSKITHLTICDDRMSTAAGALRTIFGDSWERLREDKTLPGRLRSVILQQGIMPYFDSGTGHSNYIEWTQMFVETIRAFEIDGLRADPPTPMYPGPGGKEFELLLAEWKKDALVFLTYVFSKW